MYLKPNNKIKMRNSSLAILHGLLKVCLCISIFSSLSLADRQRPQQSKNTVQVKVETNSDCAVWLEKIRTRPTTGEVNKKLDLDAGFSLSLAHDSMSGQEP